MKRRYRVGVLGLDHWYWGLNIVPQIAKHPRLSLDSVWEPQAWRLRDLDASGYHLAADPMEMIEDPGLDIVLSLLPSRTGAPWLLKAARAGKALICNKPLTFSTGEALALASALRKSRRPSFCLEGNSQLSARSRFVQGILKRGGLGRVLTVTMGMRGGMPKAWKDAKGSGVNKWGWWTDSKLVPGGAWIDHSIYALAELRGMLGAEPVSVTALMGNLKYPRKVLDMEDWGIASYVYPSGAVATLEYDWIGMTAIPSTVVCEKGRLRWGEGVPVGSVELRTAKGSKIMKIPAWKAPSVLDHVVEALDKGRDTVQPARLGALNLKAALAAYRAARTGRKQRV